MTDPAIARPTALAHRRTLARASRRRFDLRPDRPSARPWPHDLGILALRELRLRRRTSRPAGRDDLVLDAHA